MTFQNALQDTGEPLEDLNKQIKAAGIDNIQKEVQAQIDAFLAAQK
jgi:putative aldouronate transport system substrate-binding protein